MTQALKTIGASILAVATVHIILSSTSIVYGAAIGKPKKKKFFDDDDDDDDDDQGLYVTMHDDIELYTSSSRDDKLPRMGRPYLPHLDDLISDMYSGRGIQERFIFLPSRKAKAATDTQKTISASAAAAAATTTNLKELPKSPVILSKNISFEDAFAIAVHPMEVVEVFRSLGYISPESLSPPKRLHVVRFNPLLSSRNSDFGGWKVVYELHQKYFGQIELRSILIIDLVRSYERGENDDDEGDDLYYTVGGSPLIFVQKIQEYWHGIPPPSWGPIRWARRFNGMMSVALTTWILS